MLLHILKYFIKGETTEKFLKQLSIIIKNNNIKDNLAVLLSFLFFSDVFFRLSLII